MRDQEATGSHDLPDQHTTTLDDVMDLIISESVIGPQPGDILSTVTVSTWHPPQPVPPRWSQSLDGPVPTVRITEQPKQRGMRFRYQCEGRSAGSILGAQSTEHNKTLPEIELCNCEGLSEVNVTVCLVWKDPPYRVHPHSLVGKDCHDGICEVTLRPREGETKHSFSNLGIQCVKKREIESSVKDKLKLKIDPYKAGLWRHHEEVDLNVVRLCFQASYPGPVTQRMFTEPILSEPVYDKKSTNTSELRIYRMNKDSGKCSGGEELYILCDKVQKEDIQVVFTDGMWEALADFSQADVHRQIAIVLKTPPYRDLDITEPVQVFVCLNRITDSIRSDGLQFTYMPRMSDDYQLQYKKKRKTSPLEDFSCFDPHGIETKRSRSRPDYTSHLVPIDGSFGYQGAFNDYSYPMMSTELAGVPPPQLSFEMLMNEELYGLDTSYDPFQLDLESEVTSQLVGTSLLLSEEKREFEDCGYTDTQRGAGP